MNDLEFEIFIETCTKNLKRKQENLTQKYNLGSQNDFLFDQIKQEIEFRNGNNSESVKLNATVIWSYWVDDELFKWWWSNKNLTEAIQADSKKINKLYDKTKFDIFLQPHFTADTNMVNEIIAMSVEILSADWSYKIPTWYGYLLLAISNN